jgi:hypothetical protein
MKVFLISIMMVLLVSLTAGAADKPGDNPRVVLDTTKGKIVIELYLQKAPETVVNFFG